MSDFTGRYGDWAVVAGASEGLGAAFAEQLDALDKGPRVIPGALNRIGNQLITHLLPRKLLIRLIGKYIGKAI